MLKSCIFLTVFDMNIQQIQMFKNIYKIFIA